jgi:hypothetical protein
MNGNTFVDLPRFAMIIFWDCEFCCYIVNLVCTSLRTCTIIIFGPYISHLCSSLNDCCCQTELREKPVLWWNKEKLPGFCSGKKISNIYSLLCTIHVCSRFQLFGDWIVPQYLISLISKIVMIFFNNNFVIIQFRDYFFKYYIAETGNRNDESTPSTLIQDMSVTGQACKKTLCRPSSKIVSILNM